MLGIESFYTAGNTDWPHYIENAIRAHELYELDKEYVVENGEVVIVDEFTGRKMAGAALVRRPAPGRGDQGGHPQVKPENQTLATITYQNYFRLYEKLAGMTGTAITEAGEFHKIYDLDVVSDPHQHAAGVASTITSTASTAPNRRSGRRSSRRSRSLNEVGQPVLVGTASVDNSEKLSGMLKRHGVSHEVLNAKNHAREAQIVALAGAKHAVTVSTNMAGPRNRHQAGRQLRVPAQAGAGGGRAWSRATPSTWRRSTASARRSARQCDADEKPKCSSWAGSTCSARSVTRRAASTTSCAVAPAARATPASRASSCRFRIP